MYDYVLEFFSHGTSAYGGIILILVLTGAGLPIPEEVPVLAAGVLSGNDKLHVWLAFASCLVGALLGDCVMYSLGRYFGRSVLRERHWFAPYLTPEREALIEDQIKRHGLKVLLLARFLVGLRSPVFLAAGILRVPFRRFILTDLFCATVVISVFFSVGYLFAHHIRDWLQAIRQAEYLISGSVVAVIAVAALYVIVRRRRARALEHPHAAADGDRPAKTPQERPQGVA